MKINIPNFSFQPTPRLPWLTVVFVLLLSTFLTAQTTQTFTTNDTFTVPAGVTSITVEAWGAGGGGGSASSNNTYSSGGGGGAYAKSIVAVTPLATYNVIVGVGGTAEDIGGNSTFNTNIVVAAGGQGGSSSSTIGGAGGTIGNSKGTVVRYAGGNGGNAISGTSSGGGGGGAGSTSSGGNASGITRGTGAPLNGGNGGNGVSSSSDGNDGLNYGGGGSGALRSGGPSRIGGTGANGLVIISWIPGPVISVTPTTLNLGYTLNGGTSSSLTYILSGSNLTGALGNITINSPVNFEVSLTAGSGYATSINVPYSSSTLASTTVYVRFKPTASNTDYAGNITNSGGGSTTVNVAVTGTSKLTYCTSTGNTSFQTSVTNVLFNTINNTSTKSTGYNDFTSQANNVIVGSTHNLSIRVNTVGAYTNYTNAWIDWNQDGDFDDAGEAFDLGSAYNTANGLTNLSPLSITIPSWATIGSTRMRVATKYNTYPTSCENNFDGEVEDYTINILCIVPTITGTTPASRCGTGTVTLGATASAGTINWYAASTGGSSLGTGTNFTTPSIASTTTYWADATANGCTTNSRTAVTATVNSNPIAPSSTGSFICIGATATLSATGAVSGDRYSWYTASSGGTLLKTSTNNTDNIFTTPILSSTTNYWVAILNSNGCESTRTQVTATFPATSADNQNLAGTNTWVGHVYKRLDAVAQPPTDVNAFTNYYGRITEAETFNESFGGATVCLPLIASESPRSIYTEYFAVKFLMNSDKTGIYLTDIGSDDGVRLTVGGIKIYDQWLQRGYINDTKILFQLNGSSNLMLEYFETGGGNQVSFQNLTKVPNNLNSGTSQTICFGENLIAIAANNVLTDAPISSTAGYTVAYQWQQSSNIAGPFSDISGAASQNYTPTVSTPGTYHFRRKITVTKTNLGSIVVNAIDFSSVAQVVITPAANIDSVTGANALCLGDSTTYLANNAVLGGGSDSWSSNNTAVATVNSAGLVTTVSPGTATISYSITGGCGGTKTATQQLTVLSTTIATPGTITGSASQCPSATAQVYSIASVTNATTYNWTVPTGWSITAGAGTTSITVTSGTAGQNGNISVTAGNTCGTSAARTFAVTVSPATPATPSVITGTATQCPALISQVYNVAAVTNATTYNWLVPTGWSITAGAGTTSITVTSGSAGQNGNISVTAGNSCGTSTARTLAVTVSPATPATPGVITGTATQCPALTGKVYSIVAVSNATIYNWSVPTGWSITAGAGTISITVTSGTAGQNGNISVTAGNSCGTSAVRTFAVTVSPATPATPSVITGTATQCPALISQVYNVAAVTNATTYNWLVPTGWSITAGAGTTSITVTTGTAGQNGNISVTAGNSCGTSTARTLAVTVSPATPATPGAITGTATQCPALTGQVYSIIAVTNATTYNWSVPTGWSITSGVGTTSIMVTTGSAGQNGDLSVTAGNTCGTSVARTLAVVVNNCINKWKGTVSTDWNTPSNWTQNNIPAVDANIIFDDAPLNHLVLDQNRSVKDITNTQGTYRMVLNGFQLTIKGTPIFSGGAQIDASAINSTLVFAGSALQTLNVAQLFNGNVYNLTVNNSTNVRLSSGTLNLLNNLTASSGRLDAFTNSPTLVYKGTAAQNIIANTLLDDKIHHLTIDNAVGVNLNTNLTVVQNLTINNSKSLLVASTVQFTALGIITNNGGNSGLILKSDANGTASLLHNTNNVPATVKRYISRNAEDWHFLSAPVSNQEINGTWLPIGTYGNGTGYDLYVWNETTFCWIYKSDSGNWNLTHSTTNFVPGRGYLYSVQATKPTKTFEGNLNNGSFNYSLTKSTTADLSLQELEGYNLVGNPYPSSIDWSATSGWTRTNLLDSGGGKDMWVWNPEVNNYGVYNSVTQIGTNSITRYIAPMQGYFVKTGSSGNLGFDNTVRVHTGAGNWFKPSGSKSQLIRVSVQSEAGNGGDEALLQFGIPKNQWGASKIFSHVKTAPSLYLNTAKEAYSVQYLSTTTENTSVPVAFKAGVDGDYQLTLNFDPAEFELVQLEDKSNNWVQTIQPDEQYQFKANKTDNANRFVIHFTEIKNNDTALPAKLYTDGQLLYVDLSAIETSSELMVYDMLGKLLLKTTLQGNTLHTLPVSTSLQILMVRLQNQDGVLSRKLLFYKL